MVVKMDGGLASQSKGANVCSSECTALPSSQVMNFRRPEVGCAPLGGTSAAEWEWTLGVTKNTMTTLPTLAFKSRFSQSSVQGWRVSRNGSSSIYSGAHHLTSLRSIGVHWMHVIHRWTHSCLNTGEQWFAEWSNSIDIDWQKRTRVPNHSLGDALHCAVNRHVSAGCARQLLLSQLFAVEVLKDKTLFALELLFAANVTWRRTLRGEM